MLRSLKYFVLKFCCQGAKTLCLCLLLLGIFLMTVLMSSSREPRLHSLSSRVSRKYPDPVSGSLKSLQSLEMVQTAEALQDSSLSPPQSNQELYRWAASYFLAAYQLDQGVPPSFFLIFKPGEIGIDGMGVYRKQNTEVWGAVDW